MSRVWVGLAAAALLGLGAAAHAETVDAIWKTQRIAFYYGSSTTAYSCSSVTHKIAGILRRVGAEALFVRYRQQPAVVKNPVRETDQRLAGL